MSIRIISPSREYGYFLPGDYRELLDYLSSTPIPKEGNLYVRDDERMHGLQGFRYLEEKVFGLSKMESGYCNGNNKKLNCLEYHSCPEANLAVSDCILLLGLPSDIVDGKIDSKKLIAMRIKAGECFVLNPYVLHFSPCMDHDVPFQTGVFLLDKTNEDLEEKPSDPTLWKRNKWLYAHKESKQASMGAYIGIEGDNIEVI
ncbi:MAG: DUF4867 family protein [Bacilli bacterium]|nr:DUF4867 family protein [Bacilli bacterium]